MKTKRCSCLLLSLLVLVALGLGFAYEAQAATPAGGMTFVTQVPIPNWTTTGANQASTDIFSTNPVTDTVYFADRVNRGVSVINGTSLKYLGVIPVPTCAGAPGTTPGSCPSGVQVVPDLQKLIVTDRSNAGGVDLSSIFIYDLKVPTAPPIQLQTGVAPIVGKGTSAAALDTDEIDYDPINQRAYVANSKCPCFLTVVDVVNGTIVDQIPMASNLEQPRFNPVDGMIYQTMPDDGTVATGGPNDFVVRIDPSKTGAAAVVKTIAPPSGCAVRGIDVDPITNTAVVGCAGGSTGAFLLSLSGNMSILNASLAGVGGVDGLLFNPNNRRWYGGNSNNTVALAATLPGTSTVCPSTNHTTTIPAVGVYQVTGSGPATLVGADCSGVNGHGVGVDAFHNSTYIAARQFPADPNGLTTGTPGILIWHDAAPLSQGFVEQTTANISSVGGSTATGSVLFQDNRVWASLSGLDSTLSSGSFIRLNIPTTLGSSPVECISNGSGTSTAICVGFTRGYPLFGGTVLLGVRGTVVGSGVILPGTTGD